jgi:hypothetical protein
MDLAVVVVLALWAVVAVVAVGAGQQARLLLWASGSIGKWFTGSLHWADGRGEGCGGVVGGVAQPKLRPLHTEIALPDSAVRHVSCDPTAQQW